MKIRELKVGRILWTLEQNGDNYRVLRDGDLTLEFQTGNAWYTPYDNFLIQDSADISPEMRFALYVGWSEGQQSTLLTILSGVDSPGRHEQVQGWSEYCGLFSRVHEYVRGLRRLAERVEFHLPL